LKLACQCRRKEYAGPLDCPSYATCTNSQQQQDADTKPDKPHARTTKIRCETDITASARGQCAAG
jgi:hypothetical protein